MAEGISGFFDLDSTVSWAQVRVYYAETYSIETNKSALTIEKIQVKSTKWSGVAYYPDGLIKIDGTTVLELNSDIGTHSVNVNATNSWYTIYEAGSTTPANGVLSGISHNDDGSKSVTIELTGNRFVGFRFFTASGDYGNGWYVNEARTIELTNIPRASNIGATDANIGSNSSIVVAKKAATYTHSIKYEFGSLSGYITSNGGVSTSEVKFSAASVSFTVPTSFYAQIPNAKTGKCKLTCTTYSGSTKIGDAQTTEFTVTAAESSCKPGVSGTIVDINDTTKTLTGDASKLIKYYSDALCTIEATAKNSATIKTKKIGGTTVSGDTRTISAVETGSIAFAATDSRGYSASVTVKATLINYVKLTVNAQLQRLDPTSGNAVLTVKGNYFNGSFGAVANTLTCRYRLAKSGESYGSWVTVTPTKNGNSYSFSVNLSGLDYQYSYSVQVQCYDKLRTLTPVATVSKGVPVADWGANDFRFNVPVSVGGNTVSDLANPETDNDAVPRGYLRRNIMQTAAGTFAVGDVCVLKESILNRNPVFATLAYAQSCGRVGGSAGSRQIVFSSVTNSSSGLYINFAIFNVSDDGVTLTLSSTKRLLLTANGVTAEVGVSLQFGEVILVS